MKLLKISLAVLTFCSTQAIAEPDAQYDNNILFIPSVTVGGVKDQVQDASFELTEDGTWQLKGFYYNVDAPVNPPSMDQAYSVRAFYGDPSTNSVVAIDVPEMVQAGSTDTASTPYPVDKAGPLNKVYAITRGANSIDIILPDTLENLGQIDLDHRPRSGAAYNEDLTIQLVAGADKPRTSIIDPFTDTVVATAGSNDVTVPNGDYGGGLASGHPYWFSKRKFAVIDRSNRKIQLYKLEGERATGFTANLLGQVDTPTSVHHFVARNRDALQGDDKYLYYALVEGSPANNIAPKILEIIVKDDTIELGRAADLSGFDPSIMGAHHADMHPGGVYIYVGSAEGHMFVINRHTMQIVSVVETGIGSAHTRFVASRGLAIVTNHKDTFVTIVNSNNHIKIKDVQVSPPEENGQILQSHTSYVDPAAKNYYAFASDSGTFFELNLDSLTVTKTVYTGGTPRQGVFMALGDDN